MADLTLNHLQARSAGDIKLEILSETIAFPEREGFGVFAIVARRDKRIAHSQRRGHMFNERGEEITTS